MKRIVLLCALFLILCSGCGKAAQPSPDTAELVRVVFDHGHGSMWGVQFFVDVKQTEIASVSHFIMVNDKAEYVTETGLPLAADRWDAIKNAVEELYPDLRPADSAKKKLFGGQQKLDGAEYRKLMLFWKQGDAVEEISYLWPDCDAADALEQVLESIAP